MGIRLSGGLQRLKDAAAYIQINNDDLIHKKKCRLYYHLHFHAMLGLVMLFLGLQVSFEPPMKEIT